MTAVTQAVNLRDRRPGDVYMGRAGRGEDGYFGNSHAYRIPCRTCARKLDGLVVRHDGPECMRLFLAEFAARIAHEAGFRDRVLALEGKRLACPGNCKPGPCHVDVYVDFIESERRRREEGSCSS